jgi:hypothetical protein
LRSNRIKDRAEGKIALQDTHRGYGGEEGNAAGVAARGNPYTKV